ncbi:MAG: DNA polymerase IV, partial [Acidobacteria bacterium]|nr:DNA polymerase IV [Acidobacteriota bacterium]
RTVTLKIKYADFQTVTRRRTFEGFLASPEEIFLAVRDLLERTEAGRRPVRLAGISLSNFDTPCLKVAESQAPLYKKV